MPLKITLKLILFILLFNILVALPASAETIQLKSGKTIAAPIIEQTKDHIKVQVGGVTITYYTDQIESISAESTGEAVDVPQTFPPAKTSYYSIDQISEKVSEAIVVIDTVHGSRRITGTGFFISPDGLIVTNLHVVFNASRIDVILHSGASYPVQYIANYNDDHDICLLKIDIKKAPTVAFGDSEKLENGQFVFTVGHREGARYEFSSGTYHGKKMMEGQEHLQSKIVTGHGNSGGPIMNKYGEVIGLSTLFTGTGYNLSLPINTARKYFNFNELISLSDLNKKMKGAYALTFLGNGAYLEGKFGPALEQFQQALAENPDHLKAWVGAARSYTAMSMNNDAFTAWQEVVKRDADNVEANRRLGKFYLDRKMPDEALAHLQKAVQLEPDQSSAVYEDLAFAYGEKKMFNEMVAAYEKAIAVDPKSGSAYYNLAVAYFNNRNFDQAQKYSDFAQGAGYPVPESFLKLLKEPKTFKLF